METAREVVPIIDCKIRKIWMTIEILDLMDRRKIKSKSDIVCRIEIHEKEKWFNTKCDEYNQDVWKTQSLFKMVKELKRKDCKIETSYIKAKDGAALTEKGGIISRWTEYIEEL